MLFLSHYLLNLFLFNEIILILQALIQFILVIHKNNIGLLFFVRSGVPQRP